MKTLKFCVKHKQWLKMFEVCMTIIFHPFLQYRVQNAINLINFRSGNSQKEVMKKQNKKKNKVKTSENQNGFTDLGNFLTTCKTILN